MADELRTIEHAYFALGRKMNPVGASQDGVTTYDNCYGRYNDQAIAPYLAKFKTLASALEQLKTDDLQDEIDRTILLYSLKSTFREFQVEKTYVINPDFWTTQVFEGLQQLIIESDRSVDERAKAILGRLTDIPDFLENAKQTIKNPVKLFVETALQTTEGGKELIEEIETKFATVVPMYGKEIAQAAVKANQAVTVFESVLKVWLKETTNTDFAVGKKSFLFRLKYEHGLSDTLTDVWRYGMLLKHQCEIELTHRAQKFHPSGDWKQALVKLRENHPQRIELVAAYRKAMEDAKAFLEKKQLITLTNIPLIVTQTPAFRRPTTPFASYEEPSTYAKKKAGTFSVTTPDSKLSVPEQNKLIKDHCVYEIPTTSVHEGYPGHHQQLATSKSLPSETRRSLSTTLSLEGWALYCEGLMSEQGFYRSDEEEFFVWVHLLWRAIRILLDVGLHTQGMTYEQAVAYMVKNLVIDQQNAESEVRRYCEAPTAQLCYAIGRRDLLALREDYLAVHGKNALKQFHDEFMTYGGLPISFARRGMKLEK